MTKFEAVVASIDIMLAAATVDCYFAVVDQTGKVVASAGVDAMKRFVPPVGEIVPESSATRQAINNKQPAAAEIPKAFLGVRLRAQACPIFGEDGEVVGALAMYQGLETQDVLYTTAQNIAATTEELAATSEELGATAVRLAEELSKVKAGGESVLDNIQKTDEILKFVSEVATNSNLLGLNAAIEAARAGEHGRGFAVVADEIRKMATNSARSVSEITKILREIYNDADSVVAAIAGASDIGQQQAKAAVDIAATIQSLASTAGDVEKIAGEV